MSGRVRVYIASSLDGFIAGPGDDLSWLPGADGEPVDEAGRHAEAITYDAFLGEVGALLLGRRTWDVVSGFEGWGYGDRPVLVATTRPLQPPRPTVRPVGGDVSALVQAARAAAGDGDVYLDGGALIRQALDAGLVDELVLTLVPVVLGEGHPLFAGAGRRHQLELVAQRPFGGGMTQLVLRPR